MPCENNSKTDSGSKEKEYGVHWQDLLLVQVHRVGTFEPCQVVASWFKACEKKGRRIKEIKVKSILKSKNYTRWSEVRHQQQERLTTNKV